MATLAVLLVIATTLLAALIYYLMLAQGLATGIWFPGFSGLAAGGITLCITQNFTLPAFVRVVCLPVLSAALLACVSVRRQHWHTVMNAEPRASVPQMTLILLLAMVGSVIGALSGVGKPVLDALNQDVVGVLPSEKHVIEITGAAVLANVAGIVGVILGAAFLSPTQRGS